MNNNEMIVNILNKFYPDVAQQINTKIKDLVPEPIEDLSKISSIIETYCILKQISVSDIAGRINRKYHKNRREVLAILILCYSPGKMYCISKERLKLFTLKKAGEILNCRHNALSNTVPQVIVHFNVYEDFRTEVLDVYEKIKTILK